MFHLSKSKHINFVALHRAADNLVNGFPLVRKRRRLRRIYKILKYFGLALAALFLILSVLFSAKILSLKQFYGQAIRGQTNLEQAIIFAEQDEFSQAMVLAAAALDNFNFLADELGRMKNSRLADQFPFIMNQLDGLESLSTAFGFLSQAVYSGAGFGKNLSGLAESGQAGKNILEGGKKLNFSEFNPAEKRRVLSKIFESAPELNGIKADLALAYMELDQISAFGMLSPFKGKIIQTKKQINKLERILEKAVPLSQLLPALAGYPKAANYLVVLQDNGELRPTGGFLSAYGVLRFEDGDLTSFDTHDIYYLDAPVKDKIRVIPPEPIKKYLTDEWYLRDANWSPDWPAAAQKIGWFYQKESRLNPAAEKVTEPSGVIALTPKLITDFLSFVGSVAIQGKVYEQENFQDLLESRGEDASLWPKKEIVGRIIKELKNKIFALPAKDWTKVIDILADNLAAKDLMFYLTDQQLENIALESGWGGEIKAAAGDYLMVVDANLGAARTDAAINRGLEYKVTQGSNGLFSKLTLNYAHRGWPDKKTGAYKSYTRVYAPLGSRLIGLSGYELKQIEIGNESGKTWFGFYLEVQPESIKNLTIEYELPALASTPRNYELYLQKQPGKEIEDGLVDLSFLNDIKSYSPASLSTEKVDRAKIRWKGDLNMDRSFEVKF